MGKTGRMQSALQCLRFDRLHPQHATALLIHEDVGFYTPTDTLLTEITNQGLGNYHAAERLGSLVLSLLVPPWQPTSDPMQHRPNPVQSRLYLVHPFKQA